MMLYRQVLAKVGGGGLRRRAASESRFRLGRRSLSLFGNDLAWTSFCNEQVRGDTMIRQLGPAAFITTILGAALLAQQPASGPSLPRRKPAAPIFEAAQRDDDNSLVDILGPAGKDLVFSGDSSEDENSRIEFVVKYLEKHRLETGPDATAALYIGQEDLRMPIPLTGKSGVWYFDTQSGKNGILLQRIGNDEQVAA